jgi:hypothetical protein
MTTSEEIHLLCLGISIAVRLDPRALRTPLGTTPADPAGPDTPASSAGEAREDAAPKDSPAEDSAVLCH